MTTTPLQGFPRLARWHRHYFMLMPFMIEQLDLRGYDVVISSSYLVAKGVVVGPDQLHISYVHSPMRYAWDLQHEYLREMNLQRGLRGLIVRLGLHYLRLWDSRTAAGVDAFVTNSHFVARRVRKAYNREATVIYPPVDTDRFGCRLSDDERDPVFVTASRLVPYKRVGFIVEAFSGMPEHRLVVIGDGPEFDRIKAKAGPNVTLLGRQPDRVVRDHLQRATAFVYAAEEDFGITPAEAQACGTPVIAYARGGVREIVRGLDDRAPTGVLYAERTPEALQAAIRRFCAERTRIRAAACRANAERFAVARFRAEFGDFVAEQIEGFRRQLDSAEQVRQLEVRPRRVARP